VQSYDELCMINESLFGLFLMIKSQLCVFLIFLDYFIFFFILKSSNQKENQRKRERVEGNKEDFFFD